MFYNLKITIRNLRRNVTYSAINIVGLAMGIACAGLILLWVEDEVTFDNFPKSDNLYYVFEHWLQDGVGTGSSVLYADVLKDGIAGVKRVSRIKQDTRYWGKGENVISGSGCFVDSAFFSMFDIRFVAGNKASAFNTVQSVALSESMAAKLFGKDDPVGQTLKMNNQDYHVTGVYADIRKNSSFEFDWAAPIEIPIKEISVFMNPHQWGSRFLMTFVELEPKVNPASVNEQIYNLHSQRQYMATCKPFLYPLSRMHLYGDFNADGKETGGGYIATIRTFTSIVLIILLITCINFINLTTARSQKRALEVGVRKTFGGKRLALVSQFMAESALITLIALILAVIVIVLALPLFNTLVDKQLVINLGRLTHWVGLAGVGLLSCLLVGVYPAFYLSSFPPVDVLKRLKTKAGLEMWFRKGLVVFQFTISLVLIICTAFIYLQVRHVKNRSLGMNIEQVLTMNASVDVKKNFEPLKQDLLSTGVVSDAALSNALMLQIRSGWGNMNWPGKADDYDPTIQVVMVSSGMISTMGLEFVEGREFESGMPEYGYMIINEALARMMGDEGRVGGRLRQGSGNYSEIIGVVKDFVYNDMYSVHPEPLILWYNPSRTDYLHVRLKAGDMQAAVDKVGMVMKKFDPGRPFDYRFMDETFNRLFHKEQFTGKLALLFAALAILISCLGLFGLTAFAAEQRTREIGIRKVLGASVGSILQLLGRNFMALVLISFVIAIPLAWWIMYEWLNGFAYRIDESWTVFAAASLLVASIAMLTVSVQSFKAATANPVKAIKTE